MRRPIVIMKFGGTSVATEDGRSCLVHHVRRTLEEGSSPVIVVSAMGRAGDPYSTDTLRSLVNVEYCDASELDALMSVGETISSIVAASQLREANVDACAISGCSAGLLTSSEPGNAIVRKIDPSILLDLIARGSVPVVAGFQGIDEMGYITTLGRGGSDTSACALGVALNAECVEIYKDVDGVMTADPRICPDARTIERMGADELFEMSNAGSCVVHTPAAQLAMSAGMSLRIRDTFSDGPGTQVVDLESFSPNAVVSAISSRGNVSQVRVHLPRNADDGEAHMRDQSKAFDAMARAGISLDMFTPLSDRLVFCVDSEDLPRAQEALGAMGLEYAARSGFSKVTLIGAGMHGVVGVMARLERALHKAGIDVLQAADSHATIAVLVASEYEDAAVRALHSEFGLEKR